MQLSLCVVIAACISMAAATTLSDLVGGWSIDEQGANIAVKYELCIPNGIGQQFTIVRNGSKSGWVTDIKLTGTLQSATQAADSSRALTMTSCTATGYASSVCLTGLSEGFVTWFSEPANKTTVACGTNAVKDFFASGATSACPATSPSPSPSPTPTPDSGGASLTQYTGGFMFADAPISGTTVNYEVCVPTSTGGTVTMKRQGGDATGEANYWSSDATFTGEVTPIAIPGNGNTVIMQIDNCKATGIVKGAAYDSQACGGIQGLENSMCMAVKKVNDIHAFGSLYPQVGGACDTGTSANAVAFGLESICPSTSSDCAPSTAWLATFVTVLVTAAVIGRY